MSVSTFRDLIELHQHLIVHTVTYSSVAWLVMAELIAWSMWHP